MISEAKMREVYNAFQTPKKVGLVIDEKNQGVLIDCPNVFQVDTTTWGMVFVKYEPKNDGYETWYADSKDLIHWDHQRKLLAQHEDGFDSKQLDGGMALIDPEWEGSHQVQKYAGKYWMTYIGGHKPGYETDPLSIGLAYSETGLPGQWTTLKDPILAPDDADSRFFERGTLYKSAIIEDRERLTGHQFVMYYNSKEAIAHIERIGMAVSDDMVHWQRFGQEPVVEEVIDEAEFNQTPQLIAGDPQIIHYKDVWVMAYFVYKSHTAYNTFACSTDLVHWTKWAGEPLIQASEDFDAKYAHKPFILKHDGKVYHYYCAVNDQGRGIAVAVSD